MLFSKSDLRKLIIPLLIEQFLAVTVGMLDTVMVSSAGEAAVSGVSLVDNISILLIGLFAALATGGAVVAGQFLGQKNKENACKAANQVILFVGLASLIIMTLFLLGHQFILTKVFGKIDADVMRAAKTYLLITAFSIPPLALYNGGAALFRAMGNSKVTMWISLLMNLINVTGNAILIFGFKMGVAGVAIPTLISRLVAAVIIIAMLFNQERTIHLPKRFEFRFHCKMIKKILFIGVPNGLENSIFQLGKILILSLVSACGTSAIAANAVAGTVATVNTLPGNALGLAMLSVVSVCIGANDFEQVKFYTKKLMQQIHIYIGVISLILLICCSFIVAVFHLSPEATAMTEQLIRWHAICAVLFWPESFALPNMLRASNDVKFTMGIAIFSMWVFRIFFSYVLVNTFDMGVLGVWIAMTIDWLFRAIVFVSRYVSGKWKEKYLKSNS